MPETFPLSQEFTDKVAKAWENPDQPLAGIQGAFLLGTFEVPGVLKLTIGKGPKNDLIIHVKTTENASEAHIVQLIWGLERLVTQLQDAKIFSSSVRCISDSTAQALNPELIVSEQGLALLEQIVGDNGNFLVIQPLSADVGDSTNLSDEEVQEIFRKYQAALEVMGTDLDFDQRQAFAKYGDGIYSPDKKVFITDEKRPLRQGSFVVAPRNKDTNELLSAAYNFINTKPKAPRGGEA
jgi:hypothetical protein